MSSINARTLQPLLLALQQAQLELAPVLDAAGLSRRDLDAESCRISEPALRAALRTAIELSADPLFALRAGLQSSPRLYGALGHVLRNAATIGQACTLLLHYWRLVHDEEVFRLRLRGDQATFAVRRDEHADPETNRPLIEYLLAQLLQLLDTLNGTAAGPSTRQLLRCLNFRHRRPEPGQLRVYQQLLGTQQFAFNSDANAVQFDARLLAKPVALAEPALLRSLQREAEVELQALALQPELLVRLRVLLRRRLLGQAPDIHTIAADCRMSRATLQRRLASLGTSFSAELARTRHQLADEMLQRDQLSLAEIAYTLGYCDSAAFHHAYVRWSGMRPGEYRARQHAVT